MCINCGKTCKLLWKAIHGRDPLSALWHRERLRGITAAGEDQGGVRINQDVCHYPYVVVRNLRSPLTADCGGATTFRVALYSCRGLA